MRVFLTGGSGFLGTGIVSRLVTSGHEVQALARTKAAAARLGALGASPIPGDLGTVATQNLEGIEAVVHAAAPVVFWGSWPFYEREIVQASVALFRRAAAQGVRRFVYISSESVLQGRESLLDIDESQTFAEPPNSDYGRAKKAAELGLQAAFQENPACELVILRPSFIWAAHAPAVQTMAAKLAAGQFAWIDGGRTPFEAVHLENVAQAVAQALQHGRPGAAYLITDGQRYTAREFLAPLIAGAAGQPVPERSLPAGLAYALAGLCEWIWRRLGIWTKPPPLTRFEVAFLAQPRRYRMDAARRDLGYEPRLVPRT